MTTRLNRLWFTPNDEALSTVEELEGRGKTKSDIINKAILTEKKLREATSDGSAVYIEKPNGDRIKVLLIG